MKSRILPSVWVNTQPCWQRALHGVHRNAPRPALHFTHAPKSPASSPPCVPSALLLGWGAPRRRRVLAGVRPRPALPVGRGLRGGLVPVCGPASLSHVFRSMCLPLQMPLTHRLTLLGGPLSVLDNQSRLSARTRRSIQDLVESVAASQGVNWFSQRTLSSPKGLSSRCDSTSRTMVEREPGS
jgi:hypothetical protein